MAQDFKIPAFVLGMSVNGLGVVHSLAQVGVRVFACDKDYSNPAIHTKYATALICPDPITQPKELISFLADFVKTLGGRGVLFPTSDAFNEFVHKNREALKEHFLFIMPSYDLMEKLFSKQGQYDLAIKHGIAVPKTIAPKNLADVEAAAAQFQYPVLIKGLNTVTWRARFDVKKGFMIKSAQELIEWYRNLYNGEPLETVVQEIIQGDDTKHHKFCAYINREGKTLLSFTLQKVRQFPCHFGIGSTVVSKWEPEVIEVGHKFMKAMDYQGIGSVEFKKDTRDNVWKLIEVNPRLWAQNSLATAAGQNFAFTEYLDLIGEKVEPKTGFEEGIKWIAFKADRASFLGYHREGTLSLGRWLYSILGGKKVWAIWAWDDPMPFLFDVKFGLALFEKAILKIGKLLSINKNSSPVPVSKASSTITCKVISSEYDFMNLKAVWNDALSKSGIKNPFLHHEWLSAWWKGYGAGKELFIVQFELQGKAIGFAPLMKYQEKLLRVPLQAIGFLSNHWTRMDIIVTEHKKECFEALAKLLKSEKKVVIFAQMDQKSPQYQLLVDTLRSEGIPFSATIKKHAFIAIDKSWEEYFQKQSKNFRMDSKRKLKRLQNEGPVDLIQRGGTNGQAIDALKEVAKHSWQNDRNVNIVASKQGETFYREIMQVWKDPQVLDCSILQVNGQPICYMVGVYEGGEYFAFDTAFNPSFEKFSPGLIIHNLLLERLHSQGVKRFDFGYAAEYKRRWSDEIHPVSDVTIFPGSIQNRLFGWGYGLKEKFKATKGKS